MNPPSSQSSPSAGATRAASAITQANDATVIRSVAAIIDRETGAGELARDALALLEAVGTGYQAAACDRLRLTLAHYEGPTPAAPTPREVHRERLARQLENLQGPTNEERANAIRRQIVALDTAAPDLSDSGPYATGDDKATAKELGVTVTTLRAAEDRAAPVAQPSGGFTLVDAIEGAIADLEVCAVSDTLDVARVCGELAVDLRQAVAAQGGAAPVSDSPEVAALREAAAVLEGVTLLPRGQTYKRAHSALAMVREVLGEQ